VVSKLVPALALILLAAPVFAADAPSSAPSADAKTSSSHATKKHHAKKSKKAASSAPDAK
jgi:hypothetical protein